MSTDLQHISLTKMDGSTTTLDEFKGKVVLIVNVASRCGLTPQYSVLERLYREKQEEGFVVLAFPSNDFKGQEPGADEEIAGFCSSTYGVTFPLFSKISVHGKLQHPLYKALTACEPLAIGEGPMRSKLAQHGIEPNAAPAILWNFEKFLLNRDGQIVARFAPDLDVSDPQGRELIDKWLAG